MLGLKISKNIDLIKDTTSIKNRPKNFSGAIYDWLNIITLPETRLTSIIKYVAIKSIIKIIIIGIDLKDATSHSIMISAPLTMFKEIINMRTLVKSNLTLIIMLTKEKNFIILLNLYSLLKVSY